MQSRSRLGLAIALGLGLATTTACSDAPAPTGADPARGLSLEMRDGSHGGNEHFFFLPPLAGHQPRFAGVFDTTITPVVSVCEVDGDACGRAVAELTTAGAGSESLRRTAASAADAHWSGEWHTAGSALDSGKTYRIEVSTRGQVLGSADVIAARSASEARDIEANGSIAVVIGETLPIAFRIEVGAYVEQRFTDVSRLSPTDATIHYNPLDPVIATRPAGDGEVLQYQGDRDSTGTLTRLTGFTKFAWANPGARDRVVIGANGLPSSVTLRDGARTVFAYLGGTRVKVTVTLASGATAVSHFDLAATPPAPADTTSTVTAPASAAPGNSVRVQIAAGGLAPVAGAMVAGHYDIVDDATNTTVASLSYRASEQGSGVYLSPLPVLPAPSASREQVLRGTCAQLESAASAYCALGGAVGFFSGATAACGALAAVPGDGQALEAACERAFAVAGATCAVASACELFTKAFDAGTLVPGSRLEVYAEVRAAGNTSPVTQHQTFSAPFPSTLDFAFDVPFAISITTSPVDPQIYEDYVAVTTVRPIVAGRSLSVASDLQGTDGFHLSDGPRPLDPNYQSFFDIPGGPAGVVDVIHSVVAGQEAVTSFTF
ncbi:MAG TPA: hypothetical protein VF041_04855 [Gemmatimonadaceae bacterium]